VTGQWFSPGTPVSSTNKTDNHDITEILLKVALNTLNQTKSNPFCTTLTFHVWLWGTREINVLKKINSRNTTSCPAKGHS